MTPTQLEAFRDPAEPCAERAGASASTQPTLVAFTILGLDGAEFAEFTTQFRDELQPRLAVDQVECDLALLGLMLIRQAAAALPNQPLGDLAVIRGLSQGHKLYSQAMKTLRQRVGADKSATTPSPSVEEGETPIIRPIRRDDGPEPIDPLPDWQERIVFPESGKGIAALWPRVRGTDLLVEHLMSLLDDGWPAVAILRTYSQLTLDDLRACKGCDLAGLAGPPPA